MYDAVGIAGDDVQAEAGRGALSQCGLARVVELTRGMALRCLAYGDEGVERRDDVYLLFTTNGTAKISGWSKIKRHIDVLSGVSDWRVHDLRRSFATHLVELGIAPPHVVEILIGHKSGHKSGVAGVYNRALHVAERTVALEKWATIIAGQPTNVSRGAGR